MKIRWMALAAVLALVLAAPVSFADQPVQAVVGDVAAPSEAPAEPAAGAGDPELESFLDALAEGTDQAQQTSGCPAGFCDFPSDCRDYCGGTFGICNDPVYGTCTGWCECV